MKQTIYLSTIALLFLGLVGCGTVPSSTSAVQTANTTKQTQTSRTNKEKSNKQAKTPTEKVSTLKKTTKPTSNGSTSSSNSNKGASTNSQITKSIGSGNAINSSQQKVSTSTNQNSKITYKTYSNDRFGFKGQYPTTFTEGPRPTDNDGRVFTDSNGAQIIESGIFVDNSSNQSITQVVNSQMASVISQVKVPISYQQAGSNWYAISYKDGSNIVYQKSIIINQISYDLYFKYPANQQAKYGQIVTHIVNTYVPGNGEMN